MFRREGQTPVPKTRLCIPRLPDKEETEHSEDILVFSQAEIRWRWTAEGGRRCKSQSQSNTSVKTEYNILFNMTPYM
jgi:hypothetical protein